MTPSLQIPLFILGLIGFGAAMCVLYAMGHTLTNVKCFRCPLWEKCSKQNSSHCPLDDTTTEDQKTNK